MDGAPGASVGVRRTIGLNKVQLMGNLGADPEVKRTNDGIAVVNLSIATTETWTDASTGEKQKKTDWHRVTLWRKLAEIAGQYLQKGAKVYIEGKLEYRSWTDEQGQKHYSTAVVASEMQMMGSGGAPRMNQMEAGMVTPMKQPEFMGPQTPQPHGHFSRDPHFD